MLPTWARKLKEKIQSDECTFAPDGTWGICCVLHDYHYRVGKTVKDKWRADKALFRCMADEGHPLLGTLYFAAVSVWWLPWIKHRLRKPKPPIAVDVTRDE